MSFRRSTILCMGLCLLGGHAAQAQSYSIEWGNTSPGGSSSGGDYAMRATVGDASVEDSGGGMYSLMTGFFNPQTAYEILGAPFLSGITSGSTTFKLSWSNSMVGYVLDQSTDLVIWTLVPGAPAVVDDKQEMDVPMGTRGFFRLRR